VSKRRRGSDYPSDEEILAMEISEDKRLREVGIDPDGDPVEMMVEVRRRYDQLVQEAIVEKAAKSKAPAVFPDSPGKV
jgi:hypothetical protein